MSELEGNMSNVHAISINDAAYAVKCCILRTAILDLTSQMESLPSALISILRLRWVLSLRTMSLNVTSTRTVNIPAIATCCSRLVW